MGGPGVVMSRGLLMELRKYMKYCVKHLYSPHEDVELGRCVWKYVKGAAVPVSYEMIDYFFQQYDKVSERTHARTGPFGIINFLIFLFRKLFFSMIVTTLLLPASVCIPERLLPFYCLFFTRNKCSHFRGRPF